MVKKKPELSFTDGLLIGSSPCRHHIPSTRQFPNLARNGFKGYLSNFKISIRLPLIKPEL